MRVKPTHVLLLVVLMLTILFAMDTATAVEVGTQVDCYPSPGGAYEICM